jgi:hypothetical protein
MKRLAFFTVILIIMWAALFKSAAYLSFKLEQERVVQELCIQKDAELNTCLGSCYLRDKLALQNNHTNREVPTFRVDLEDLQFIANHSILKFIGVPVQINFMVIPVPKELKGILQNLWKPPKLVNPKLFVIL